MAIIRFGEWLPDLPDLENPGSKIARNVFAAANSYLPYKALAPFSNALAARCQGALAVKDTAGDVRIYAGTGTKLYTLNGQAWTDVTNIGGDYATAAESNWRFVKWLGDQVIATNFDDAPQVITIGGANFADLGGTPPQAKYIAVVRDFVALGHTNSDVNGVRWSGFGNAATWAVDPSTQAGSQVLGTGSPVTGLVGGEYGVVITEDSVWLMTYRGPPVVFQFDETLPGIGSVVPNSIVRFGDTIYLWSKDGFRSISGGRQSESIGKNRVDKTFDALLDYSNVHKVTAVVDPLNTRAHWAIPLEGGSAVPSRIFTFNWVENRWTEQEEDLELLAVGAESGTTLDSLDAMYPDIDQIPISLDDPFWAGGNFQLAAFDENHKLGFFNGAIQAAVVETGEIQLSEGRKTFLRRVRPLVDDASATVSIGTRDRQSETTAYTTEISQNSNGVCARRTNARYHRLRLTTASEFTQLQGIELNAEDYQSVGRSG